MADIDEHPGAAGEESPLIGENGTRVPNNGPNKATTDSVNVFPTKNIIAVSLIIGTIVLFEIANLFQELPTLQLLEEIICRDITGEDSDVICGGNQDVQAELAYLRGWQLTLALIPGIITAVPYGVVIDRLGRKVGLYLSVTGILLTQLFSLVVVWFPNVFPVRAIWAASLFTLIGGGPVILDGIIFAMLADVAPAAYRSSVFFYFIAAVTAVGLVFSTVTVKLMQIDVWLPIYIGLALLLPILPLCYFIPETLPSGHGDTPSRDGDGDIPNQAEDAQDDIAPEQPQQRKTVSSAVKDALASLANSTAFFFDPANRHIALLLVTFLTTTVGKHSQDILLQYVRNRYGWSWAQTGYLVSLRAFINLLLLLIILPFATYALVRWERLLPTSAHTPLQRDLWVAQGSCAILILGSVLIGLSPNAPAMIAGVVLYSLGTGYNIVLRSLLAALVQPEHLGTLFNTAGILDSVGAVVAGPLLAAALSEGIHLKGFWIGLPFLAAAGLFSIAMAVLTTARLPAE
ncbi:hypothetical protein SEUCBS140593_005492 [Sporothrix eucalyptigena]|uniref:Major facilitator superfamily (MFS) profile domain-containing protein n=1 Tax=Sporothrix eucalyptigena TaxID=1812306 RepID=A0ABP0BYN8_9PEZI